jgi:hypothetical protein
VSNGVVGAGQTVAEALTAVRGSGATSDPVDG